MRSTLRSGVVPFALIFSLLFSFTGCGGVKVVRIPIPIPTFGIGSHSRTAVAQSTDPNDLTTNPYILPSERIQYGIASWYGKEFHGRRAANGEPYDMYALTAAHRTLPFNTKIKVTNLESGKSCILRVNDRGPFVDGRILDVSYQSAKDSGFINQGITEVRIEVL